jgi:hypothetical protein
VSSTNSIKYPEVSAVIEKLESDGEYSAQIKTNKNHQMVEYIRCTPLDAYKHVEAAQ